MYHRVFRADNIAVRAALLALRVRFNNQVDDESIGRLELALAEVLNNICEHGGDALSLSAGDSDPEAAHDPQTRTGAGTTRPAQAKDQPVARESRSFVRKMPPEKDHAPTIHLCVIRQNNGLACAITDDGIALPEWCLLPFGDPTFSTFRSRESDVDTLPEGGFGWYLIQDLTRAMCYYREDQRNFLAFTVPYSAGSEGERSSEPDSTPCAPCRPPEKDAAAYD
ncbi:ATP-binding protein [Paracoccus cavernae]|uniref:ATP-binding protein n=1 Tax=Paracoccus cavernae TaxID=1571207 RepID=A0ABT8DA44_9RHOB|nr:ATP-binding protein [Paracoccus cavernae]